MGQGKRFIKGLFKDTARLDQPNETWRYARNLIMTNKEGSISNEGGTEMSGHLGGVGLYTGQNDVVVGAIEVNDDKVILFIIGDKNPTVKRSEIGIWDDGTYTILYNPNISAYPGHDLNFKTSNPIEGTFKINPKGDLIIYWTDDLNPPRAFNVSRQERWLDTGGSLSRLYGINPAATPNPKHIELLNLFPNSGPIPRIQMDEVVNIAKPFQKSIIEGGGLRTAVYYLSLAYVDDDFVATNYLTVSNPVSIVDEFDHTLPTQKKDGAKEGNQTTKAIKWKVDKLNTDYKYLRPAVIRSMGESKEVYKLNDVEIPTNGISEVVFSGIEGFSPGSVEDVMIDTTSYDTAKTINQLDGVLYLGNLTGSKDVGYQKYANNIKLRATTVPIENFDEFYATVDNLESGFGSKEVNVFGQAGSPEFQDPSKSYRYMPNIVNNKGYMRDEIYAFYIAFIMNDGTMSYAYHIPGREDLQEEKGSLNNLDVTLYGGLWKDFHNVSPGYAKRFHFIDSQSPAIGSSYSLTNSMGMNYWENATEFYPSSEDYEVWSNTGQIGTIQGENVRHHHFPSNKNTNFRSIDHEHQCETRTSDGTVTAVQPFNGTLIFSQKNTGGPTYTCASNNSGNPIKYEFDADYERDTNAWPGNNDLVAAQAMWQGFKKFTANQAMKVDVNWQVWFHQLTSMDEFCSELHTDALSHAATSTNGTMVVKECIGNGTFGTGLGGCAGTKDDFNGQNTGTSTIDLEPGESIWIQSYFDDNCSGNKKCDQSTQGQVECYPDDSSNVGGCSNVDCRSYIKLVCTSASTSIDPANLSDVKLSHVVNRLGFHLEDIKIPQSIADKVQGFKVYYAKRSHANRTVLGQSPLLPAFRKRTQLGICEEAGNDPSAQRVMSTLQTLPEDFWSMDPYPRTYSRYPNYPSMYQQTGSATNSPTEVTDAPGYKVFSFHDFYLLRTKNSLSTATHIDIQYRANNLVFNGPGLNQDKKMLSLIRTDTDNNQNEVKVIEETWGWDKITNCWAKDMRSAIFLGAEYRFMGSTCQPRLLGQKSKTYLMGDSIFKGSALGFGGKLFNEYGESSIVFGVKDNHEIPTYWMRGYRNEGSNPSGLGVPSTFAPDIGSYGTINSSSPPVLVNPLSNVGTWDGSGGHQRSQVAITNLKAFKTDVYKSIDSQDLVWTGFQVTGEDLENFVFDESGAMGGSGNTDFLQPEGIFGGDTFLCRYGIVTSLTPSDTNTPAEPEKGIHFHIVESTDNINFRHMESDKSAYFPGAIAKDLLREAGTEDFTHVDNLKYNENYSELNDMRPAFPLPLRESKQEDFPTRTHRSAKHDTTNLIDNYRIFLALQFKDLPKNRGDLWKLSSFNNLLYFHMQESLFAAKGKESMQMGDGSEAFIGSGDIFSQEPDEVMQTKSGYGGTQSQWASIVTKSGYFFVDISTRKVFLMTDQLTEISQIGMKQWFKDNLIFTLEEYGVPASCLDNPIIGMGLHSVWDPKHKRIILTKRDLAPTELFIRNFKGVDSNGDPVGFVQGNQQHKIRKNINGCGFQRWQQSKNSNIYTWTKLDFASPSYFTKESAWTISYYPDLQIWVSFHDYLPYKYFSTSTDFYSFTDSYTKITGVNAPILGTDYGNAGIWKHNANIKGVLYQDIKYGNALIYNPFEFEIIHNEFAASDALYYNFGYTIEVFNYNADENLYNLNVLEHGFTNFFVYNTFQISGDKVSSPIEYLVNTRRVGNNWKINKFRDLAAIALETGNYYMAGTLANPNVIGGANTGTITTSSTVPMFDVAGMIETPNPNYIDFNKNWNVQKKFIDKWLGIRLIYDNRRNNLLNLYSTNVNARPFYR